MYRSTLAAVLFFSLPGAARAGDPAPAADVTATAVPYQKLVGDTFVKDLDGKTVTVQLVYDAVAPSQMVTMYKMSHLDVKDRVFILHHDPAGQAALPSPELGGVMPPFAVSFAKADADKLIAMKPGTVVEITGLATKSTFGMMSVKTVGLAVEVSAFHQVDAAQ